ncbi:efflux RND transporter periplasmic adaptor subunit [Streptococcus sp. BJSWXB6CM1]|uniref:Efflux RND transporter periplasmic adaptor subunit n=1 Tax=Streptococcus fermentans TaxID=3095082 RepID=A0ABU5FZC3_9STRE|nr:MULTISPECIES: efflux RND transporter periplasmic adaptor subunit [unclassified Streptococcus]MDY4345283.1 efflux RND transporter periplasmic adaptor subunit [Streptococcus sp. BJSWXB5TM5]MDY4360333.1 efflux RND transporter periplasmic adaptor subunit [Streptococcus sp. BJSWXB3CM3]MDY4370466.1 efflux RND transporter periplasmic adaptor subunit [Streptococcus sp. BJSWXB6CM1]
MKRKSKAKKWPLFTAIGVASVLVVGAAAVLLLRQPNQAAAKDETAKIVLAKEGSVASSVLLSGSVTAQNEQYIYYDASKGDLDEVLVSVGDQVSEGQALVKYSSTEAQAAYDAASRAVAKANRHINELNESRNTAAATPSLPQAGLEGATGQAPAQSSSSATAAIDSQISDARDVRADAEAQLEKAQAQLNAATVLSTVEGTVVEVNRNVSKSPTGNSQVLVHIVSNDNLQVKGELSEYNLANLSVGQEVTFTSKVYPDKTWNGKISYISNYPKNNSEASSSLAASNTGSKYPYTIDVTSEIGDLKQGFTVSVEVKSTSKALIVPITSVVMEEDKNYVWILDENQKAKKVEVGLGNADAENQEITSGLTDGAKVISNPTASLQEGKEVKTDEATN